MNRIALIFGWLLLPVALCAQQRLVVCDVETLHPISDVSVQSSAGTTVTDSLGYFSVPDSCKSIVLTHINYESQLLNLTEVRDTVFLLSKDMSLQEVVVFGNRNGDEVAENMNKMLVLDKTDAQLLAADPSGGVNLLGLFRKFLPKIKSRSAKRREKAKEIIENY